MKSDIKKYPINYSVDEIIEKIKSQSVYLMKKDLTPAAAAKYSGRITIGLMELQNRKQEKLNHSIEVLNNQINLLGKITEHFSTKQLSSLSDLDNSLVKLNNETESLTSNSNQEIFQLNLLNDIIYDLKDETVKFRKTSDKYAISSSKFTKISIGLVVLSVIISSFALYFSLKDNIGDKLWEKHQIDAINELNQSIKSLKIVNEKNMILQDSIYNEIKKNNVNYERKH